LWAEIEETVREIADRDGEIYVVTGAIFARNSAMLRGRVRVPSALYKAVYDPVRGQAAAYVAANNSPSSYSVISIAELNRLAGVDVFPALPASVRNRAMHLPTPGRPAQTLAGADGNAALAR
jgi:endonuclease G